MVSQRFTRLFMRLKWLQKRVNFYSRGFKSLLYRLQQNQLLLKWLTKISLALFFISIFTQLPSKMSIFYAINFKSGFSLKKTQFSPALNRNPYEVRVTLRRVIFIREASKVYFDKTNFY